MSPSGKWPPDWWHHRTPRVRSWWFSAVVAMTCLGTTALAEEARPFWEAPDDAQVAVKRVTGELSLVRPGSISLVYQRDEKQGMDYEMVLPLSKNYRLVYKRSLDELHVGDTVRVTCRHDQSLRDLLPAFEGQQERYVVWGEGTTDEMCLGLLMVTRP